MTLEEYKKNKGGHTFGKTLKSLVIKLFACTIILVAVLYICNVSETTKELVKEELFRTNINFSKINKIYNNFFGKEEDSEPVSLNLGIDYNDYEPYFEGVSIDATEGENIYLIDSGIIVFIGEKDTYGNTIIVQQSDGVDVWYGNIDNISVNLYDYVNKNTAIATVKDKLYLVFQKDGEYLDYKEYIQ